MLSVELRFHEQSTGDPTRLEVRVTNNKNLVLLLYYLPRLVQSTILRHFIHADAEYAFCSNIDNMTIAFKVHVSTLLFILHMEWLEELHKIEIKLRYLVLICMKRLVAFWGSVD